MLPKIKAAYRKTFLKDGLPTLYPQFDGLATHRKVLGTTQTGIVLTLHFGLYEGEEERRDASGNVLKKDIGEFLKRKIEEYFKKKGGKASVKYFDPSYSIRSVPALGTDAILCHLLAKNAVHAAMAGKTNCVIGKCADIYMHVPIALATIERQKINVDDTLWQAVLDTTCQERYFGFEPIVKSK
jgi:6-phosphofructokinase 1